MKRFDLKILKNADRQTVERLAELYGLLSCVRRQVKKSEKNCGDGLKAAAKTTATHILCRELIPTSVPLFIVLVWWLCVRRSFLLSQAAYLV